MIGLMVGRGYGWRKLNVGVGGGMDGGMDEWKVG